MLWFKLVLYRCHYSFCLGFFSFIFFHLLVFLFNSLERLVAELSTEKVTDPRDIYFPLHFPHLIGASAFLLLQANPSV